MGTEIDVAAAVWHAAGGVASSAGRAWDVSSFLYFLTVQQLLRVRQHALQIYSYSMQCAWHGHPATPAAGAQPGVRGGRIAPATAAL